MSANLYACISHKGGTGRTTTAANVAYRLALRNRSVCCIDLDLESPTFGAVVGLPGLEQGAPVGIHDFLHVDGALRPRPPEAASDALVDVWRHATLPRPPVGRAGRLHLLPGSRERLGIPLVSTEKQGEILARIVATLRGEYDHVLLDVRSGVSATVEAVLAADDVLEAVNWLVFFRWTPQHLLGAGDLCERLAATGADISLVRTAYREPDGLSSWYRDQHRELTKRARSVLGEWDVVASIAAEPMLQWKEGIVTEENVRDGIADSATIAGYELLAGELDGRR